MRDLNQVAIEPEAAPGTAETLAAANVLCRIRDGDSPDFPIEMVDTEEIQASSSSRPNLIGTEEYRASISWILRAATSGANQIATAPILQGGMLYNEALKSITCGSVTSGPFVHGETITGTNSSATGTVFRDHAASPIQYFVLTGVFEDAETITGGTSGATATSSSTPSADGFVAHFVDSEFAAAPLHHYTMEWLRDGVYWQGRGCLGEISMEFRADRFTVCRAEVLGAYSADGDKAFYTVPVYPDEAVTAARFLDASLTMGGYTPTDIVDFNLTFPLGLELRLDANDTNNGIRFADYDRRNNPPVITFDPAMVTTATEDFFATFQGGTTFAMTWDLGDEFTFYADECQIITAGVGSRRNLATLPLSIRLNGTLNDEIYMWSKP